MSPSQVVDHAKSKFQQSFERFSEELKKLRTGRAHASMLDGIMVEAYGSSMPLMQVGSVSVPEPQQLQITPFDPTNIQAISTAIRDNQSLGLNPMDDGRVVRIQIPPLNEERRRDFVKILNTKVEDCMISFRNSRHENMKELDQAKKDGDIGEDDWVRFTKQIDESMGKVKAQVDELAKSKEQEIMTV